MQVAEFVESEIAVIVSAITTRTSKEWSPSIEYKQVIPVTSHFNNNNQPMSNSTGWMVPGVHADEKKWKSVIDFISTC